MKTDKTEIVKKEELEIGIPRTKWNILDEPTPKEKIKRRRKEKGGQEFDYVDTGYVIKKLDEVFNKAWDFEIVDKQIGHEQIWVLGKLTVKFLVNGEIHTITKMQFGGSEVKKTKEGIIIDIADDLKAAASDSLKKCSSLLGVAGDIYFQEKQLNTQENVEKKWQKIQQETCQHLWREAISQKTGKKYKVCVKCKKFEWVNL